jgi:predicted dehydrogenase
MSGHHILILGSGSVGRRHARNLHALGCRISVMDPRSDRLDQAAAEVPVEQRFASLHDALDAPVSYSGVAVCSPPQYHVEQSISALSEGLPILLEKPVSPEAASCRVLAEAVQRCGKLLLGYTYRWWPPLKLVRSIVESGTLGSLRHARFVMSAHLADWHPWERYQDFFMASKALGGGALLDESHFIDLMLWFFGMPERVFARVEKISNLEIDTDDLVDISAAYPDGLRVSIHLDLFGRPHEKHIVICGEKGTVRCLFSPDEVQVGRAAEDVWERHPFEIERNDMFVGVASDFLKLIESDGERLVCDIQDGSRVLEVVEACRRSQASGRDIVMEAPPPPAVQGDGGRS